MGQFQELVALLENRRVRIQTHDFPDPDAIASAFGLQYLLREYGIESEICYCGRIDKVNTRKMLETFEIAITPADRVEDPREEDVIITVDGQKNNSNFTDLIGDEIACIDHHPWVTNYEYAYVDHQIVGACATIVTGYFLEQGIELPENVATALLYGIKMDTQNFCNGVQRKDIRMFEYLHEHANHDLISELDNNTMEISDLRAYGAAIQGISIYDRVGFAHIPFDCPDGLIAQVSTFILSLDAVDVAVIYAERNGGFKFSVRSEVLWLNAGQLVNLALRDVGNGGGHPTMAGGLLYAERKHLLGQAADTAIQNRFLNVYQELKKEMN